MKQYNPRNKFLNKVFIDDITGFYCRFTLVQKIPSKELIVVTGRRLTLPEIAILKQALKGIYKLENVRYEEY